MIFPFWVFSYCLQCWKLVSKLGLLCVVDSNQQTAPVTFVRVSGNEGDGAGSEGNPEIDDKDSNAILMLDQEHISRLETIINSEEAKGLLGEDTSREAVATGLGDLLNIGSSGDDINPAIGPPPPLIPNTEVKEKAMQEAKNSKKSKVASQQRRKSQRQIDRELKEEANRIRKENLEMEKREKEALHRQSMEVGPGGDWESKHVLQTQTKYTDKTGTSEPSNDSPANTRPKRQRKLPAHLKGEDFEYSYKGPNDNREKSLFLGQIWKRLMMLSRRKM